MKTLIIKSKPIDISILDYKKEYGEKNYNGFKLSAETDWENICTLDSTIRKDNEALISANDYCGAGGKETDPYIATQYNYLLRVKEMIQNKSIIK